MTTFETQPRNVISPSFREILDINGLEGYINDRNAEEVNLTPYLDQDIRVADKPIFSLPVRHKIWDVLGHPGDVYGGVSTNARADIAAYVIFNTFNRLGAIVQSEEDGKYFAITSGEARYGYGAPQPLSRVSTDFEKEFFGLQSGGFSAYDADGLLHVGNVADSSFLRGISVKY